MHSATESPDVWLGELLQTGHRLPEAQNTGFVDTLPLAVLYLVPIYKSGGSGQNVAFARFVRWVWKKAGYVVLPIPEWAAWCERDRTSQSADPIPTRFSALFYHN
jgi:hypothetical protein